MLAQFLEIPTPVPKQLEYSSQSLAYVITSILRIPIKSLCKNYQASLWKRASLVAQAVRNLPAMQETWVPSLGGEDPLEKGKAAHTSILA